MVAINTTNNSIYLARQDSPEVEKIVLTKQQKRKKEQDVRKAKKNAKRQAKAIQKELRTVEKESKQDDRDQKLAEEQLMEGQGLSGKEMEEQKRQQEEDILFEEYLQEEAEPNPTVNHTKKSAFDSNRLGMLLWHK